MEEAKTALTGDNSIVVLAQCYEIIGDVKSARDYYETALKKAPNSPEIFRTWVEFLLKTNSFVQAEKELKEFPPPKKDATKAEQDNWRWAQYRLIDALRAQQKIEKLDEALILLNEQIKKKSERESADDKRRMAQILAVYPSPEKRKLAIDILEKLVAQEKVVAMEAEERWMLAGLYQRAGDSEKSRAELRNLIATRKDDARALVGYIELSLLANELSEADLYFSSLKKLAPRDQTTLDLEIKIMNARKNYMGIANLLKSIDAGTYENEDPEATLRRQNWIARHFATTANKLVQINDIRASKEFNVEADNFFTKLVKQQPDLTLAYAEFLSVTPQIDRSLDLVQEHINDIPFARLERITRNVMKNRLSTTEQFQRLEGFLKSRDGKDEFIPLALVTADLLSWQGKLEASADQFKEILKRDNNNVIVLNNYAVVLALAGVENKEALLMINKAINAGGPMDAFYDTRGMVHLAGGHPELAVVDFEKSAGENDSAERRFHAAIAYAQMASGAKSDAEKFLQSAKNSLARADALGLFEHELHPVERTRLEVLRKELDMPATTK